MHSLKLTESEIQSQIIEVLKLHQFIVLTTTVKLRGRRPGSHNTGQSKGIPDLLVSKKNWPLGMWLGLEVKCEDGKLKPEQETLREWGRIMVVRSMEEALDVVKKTDDRVRIRPQVITVKELDISRGGDIATYVTETRKLPNEGNSASGETQK